jgi:hypothetical protein
MIRLYWICALVFCQSRGKLSVFKDEVGAVSSRNPRCTIEKVNGQRLCVTVHQIVPSSVVPDFIRSFEGGKLNIQQLRARVR